MKTGIQYVNDTDGRTQAVQLPLVEWNKILAKLKKYEQALQLRSDLKEAYLQLMVRRYAKGKKQTMNEFPVECDVLKSTNGNN